MKKKIERLENEPKTVSCHLTKCIILEEPPTVLLNGTFREIEDVTDVILL